MCDCAPDRESHYRKQVQPFRRFAHKRANLSQNDLARAVSGLKISQLCDNCLLPSPAMTDQPLPEVFEVPTAQPKNRKRPRVSLSLNIAIIALVTSIASISASSEESQVNSVSKDPAGENDLFYPPADLPGLIAQVEQSIVDITCGESGGTGFAYSSDASEGYATVIVTNHHVIDECLDGKGTLTVAALNGKEIPAIIDNYDVENDLASVATSLELKPLNLSEYEPWPGYWVAAIGSADGYEGSVAFGNVLNGSKYEVLITSHVVYSSSIINVFKSSLPS